MPCPPLSGPSCITSPTNGSPTPSVGGGGKRRPSSALLHPDHARLFALRAQTSPDQVFFLNLFEIF